MSEKPILFSGLMVRAILDGRKTQTRRVVKIQPPEDVGEIVTGRYHPVIIDRDGVEQPGRETFGAYDYDGQWGCRCPWESGDLLYVRETWGTKRMVSLTQRRAPWDEVVYRAGRQVRASKDAPPGNFDTQTWPLSWSEDKPDDRWRPSIHMPKWAARIWLRVTDVRVERLQEITEMDAKAEGFEDTEVVGHSTAGRPFGDGFTMGPLTEWTSASGNFARLWEALNAKRGYGWDANPWVWVVSFERSSK